MLCKQICGTPGVFVGTEAYLTGDGKAMLNSNFLEGEKCWLCDLPEKQWLANLRAIDTFPSGPHKMHLSCHHLCHTCF